MDNNTAIVECPKCAQKLRLPINVGSVLATCPKCKQKFFWNSRNGITGMVAPSRSSHVWVALLVCLAIIGVFTLIMLSKSDRPVSTPSIPATTERIAIEYRDLIDPTAIIRTGERLIDAIRDPGNRDAVQPLIDTYSRLLSHSIDMIETPGPKPFIDITQSYPIGSPAPAWVAMVRGGRIHLTTDFDGNVRLFLLGANPKTAYEAQYSIVRHCLNDLARSVKRPLSISVYAYAHDYVNSTLTLIREPYRISESRFSSRSKALDVQALLAFFNSGLTVVGAHLGRHDGLVMIGDPHNTSISAGRTLTLADLAVAYRAVFHAGDNSAFVSLDPHRDPTKVKCNFGGYLEDTYIGSVILRADKRFKTISTGLDPDSHLDIRNETRRAVPLFRTSHERSLSQSVELNSTNWIGTRFWFYPDNITVESDSHGEYAVITKPRFTADAERSRSDFRSSVEFDTKKKSLLSPHIRANIDMLNSDYDGFSKVFPELRDLDNVARLMGLCTWMLRTEPKWLDLDELLSIELPVLHTDRELTQFITVSSPIPSAPNNRGGYSETENVETKYISPFLKQSIREYFSSPNDLAIFLSHKNILSLDIIDNTILAKAHSLYSDSRNLLVHDLIDTEHDLQSFVSYASDQLPVSIPKHIQDSIDNLSSLTKQLEELDMQMARMQPAEFNSHVARYNSLVAKRENLRQSLMNINQDEAGISKQVILGITGGINMHPDQFNIRTSPGSPAIAALKTKLSSGQLVRSDSLKGRTRGSTEIPMSNRRHFTPGQFTSSAEGRWHGEYTDDRSYWIRVDAPDMGWRDYMRNSDGTSTDREFIYGSRSLRIETVEPNGQRETIVGNRDGQTRIVFKTTVSKEVSPTIIPPVWWMAN